MRSASCQSKSMSTTRRGAPFRGVGTGAMVRFLAVSSRRRAGTIPSRGIDGSRRIGGIHATAATRTSRFAIADSSTIAHLLLSRGLGRRSGNRDLSQLRIEDTDRIPALEIVIVVVELAIDRLAALGFHAARELGGARLRS